MENVRHGQVGDIATVRDGEMWHEWRVIYVTAGGELVIRVTASGCTPYETTISQAVWLEDTKDVVITRTGRAAS